MGHAPVPGVGVSHEIALALRSLLRAGRHMHSAMGQQLALGDTDLSAMDELARTQEPLGPVELGNRLGIRSASATMLVDRLEAAGHLRRERHPSDRRRVVLHTTPEAILQVRAALAPMLRSVDEIVSGLDEDQARTVLQFLREITEAMWAYPGQDPVADASPHA